VTPAKVSTWNIANQLTILRLILVPGVIALLLADGGHSRPWRIAAFVGAFIAGMTDRYDGQLARSRGLETSFGKIADPIADKALTGGLLITLSSLGDLPWWVTIVIVAREVGVTVLRFWVIRHGVIPASRGGKLKTLVQGFAIGFYILPFYGVFGSVRWWVMALAVAITLVTGVDYVGRALRIRRPRPAP
jgi:CDP-diacylglycerol--glycerol-3-phosphate 3-phosphatidyltransferase